MTGKCCCGVMSSKTGAKILAFFYILGAMGMLVGAAFPSAEDRKETEYRVSSAIFAAFSLLAGLLVFLAINKRRSNLMIPAVAISAIVVIFVAVYFVVSFYAIFDSDSWMSKIINEVIEKNPKELGPDVSKEEMRLGVTIMSAVFGLLWLLLSLWFFLINWDCYKHLKQEEFEYYAESSSSVQYKA